MEDWWALGVRLMFRMDYRGARMGLALYSTLPCGLGKCDGDGEWGVEEGEGRIEERERVGRR